MALNDKMKNALDGIMGAIENGDFPDKVARAMFTTAPISKWSLLNQLNCLIEGTSDARGYNQWKAVERHVKKGVSAIHILVPCFKKKEREIDGPAGPEVREYTALMGFKAVPVFAVEDTEGKELDYEIAVKDVPLLDVAEKWGIKVSAAPGGQGHYGCFYLNEAKIQLCSPDWEVFYHELAHASHQKVLEARGQKMTGGQNPEHEIVAELSAMVLARLFGTKLAKEGTQYEYIKNYAKDPYKMCFSLVGDVEKVLKMIIATAEEGQTAKVAA